MLNSFGYSKKGIYERLSCISFRCFQHLKNILTSSIKKSIYKCIPTAKTIRILFHEQMECERGWKKAYSISVGKR